ncbi:MAG: DUF5610 domain-containing protein, partial [Candidatus Muirbacterium halophilum]|nr:DUF5610 domain-containing protein [Candidatus Muirbacterium halophilum]
EEIWKKNQTLPPAKEKEEVVKKEKEIRDFSSKKVVSNIVDFSKSLYKYVKHNEFEKNDKEVSEKDFGVWALENVVKGFEKAQAKLGSLYKADENLSVMIDETFKKSYEEIENYFIKEDTHSKEEITGIDEKHLSFFEASKEYTGIFIFE